MADGAVRRITATESAEYQPRWSPDGKSLAFLGTRRGLTDLETTMEDTHVWLMAADGSGRRELGAAVDNRQGAASWAPDGRSIYCTVQERGHVRLVELPLAGSPVVVVSTDGRVGDYSVSSSGSLAYTFTSRSDLAQLYAADLPRRVSRARRAQVRAPPRPPSNAEVLRASSRRSKLSFVRRWAGAGLDASPMIHGGPTGNKGRSTTSSRSSTPTAVTPRCR